MEEPPHSLHVSLRRLCWQMPAPPHSTHMYFSLLCSQMPEPWQSLHLLFWRPCSRVALLAPSVHRPPPHVVRKQSPKSSLFSGNEWPCYWRSKPTPQRPVTSTGSPSPGSGPSAPRRRRQFGGVLEDSGGNSRAGHVRGAASTLTARDKQ